MQNILSVAIGGSIGALLRYWTTSLARQILWGYIPWGTLSVNLFGSFFIGLLFGIFKTVPVSENMQNFFLVGLLGSFTTFSTFSLENMQLLRQEKLGLFFINITASFILGILLVFLGYFISKVFAH